MVVELGLSGKPGESASSPKSPTNAIKYDEKLIIGNQNYHTRYIGRA
jgi:hypothetical protein